MRRLVVTADDFGLSVEVNEAVEIAHRQGILTAASLMVGAPAAADAVARARAMPGLRVGLHLVLVEGRAMLPPSRLRGLVDGRGRLRTDMARLGLRIALDRGARRRLRSEIVEQLEAFRATGLPLDHVNAHKHFHLHPAVAPLVIGIGRDYGVTALRVPVEPRHILVCIERTPRSLAAIVAAPWAVRLRRQARAAGLTTPDSVFGLAWSGAVTERRLAGLLRSLPEGLTEIYMHPAVSGDFAGAAAGYRFEEELGALVSPRCAGIVQSEDVVLSGFDAARRRRAPPNDGGGSKGQWNPSSGPAISVKAGR